MHKTGAYDIYISTNPVDDETVNGLWEVERNPRGLETREDEQTRHQVFEGLTRTWCHWSHNSRTCDPNCPSEVEDVGDLNEWGELGEGFFGIGNITLDVLNRVVGVPRGALGMGYAVDLPRTTRGVDERKNLG
ncbi:hypothetical protein NE237_000935 [Protea cynaroides]|uniref:Uncharacterized protein n=1 Tax=Protea cynaroides TaxID=273540 RepID=A0A9Q0KSI8_9MAGN|nr:hypothetical protein NE237_000935 [Protea cynaroides]